MISNPPRVWYDRGMSEPKRLLSPSEAAALLDVSPRMVRVYIASGELPATNLHPRGKPRWVIELADLQAFQQRPRPRPGWQRGRPRKNPPAGAADAPGAADAGPPTAQPR